jgi:hypothetical protein
MAAGAALIALLLTSACGGDSSASPTPSPSRSPSPTATSTTPTPPALPAAAKKNTKAGAIAFVRHYVEVLNYAQESGDVEAIRELSSTACETCKSVAGVISDLYERGGTVKGGERTVGRHVAQRGSGGWLVLLRVRSAPQRISIPGEETRELPGGSKSEEFLVTPDEDGWKVSRWSRID